MPGKHVEKYCPQHDKQNSEVPFGFNNSKTIANYIITAIYTESIPV